MKSGILFLLLIAAYSCNDKSQPLLNKIDEPFSNSILKSSANISVKNDTVFVKGNKYSGIVYTLGRNNIDTVSIDGFMNGLIHGISRKWFLNKQLAEERHYVEGKKNGRQISYWENGNKKFEFVAKDDAYEGELKEWNIDGSLIHLANFKNGQEEGTQKLWYDNGKIRANYVMVKGKRYGLLGTKNCRNVSDSIFIVK
jgi:antitoxin component YwqK of YwqJK toxin-antitoxin module